MSPMVRPITTGIAFFLLRQSLSRLLLIQGSFLTSHSPMIHLREGAVLIWLMGNEIHVAVYYGELLERDGYEWCIRVARHGWGRKCMSRNMNDCNMRIVTYPFVVSIMFVRTIEFISYGPYMRSSVLGHILNRDTCLSRIGRIDQGDMQVPWARTACWI